MNNSIIRCSIRSLYDMQKIRIQNGNRICAAFRYKLGLESSQAEEENEEASDLLKELRSEFKRITDGVKRITKDIKCDSPLITTRSELALLESYERQIEAEIIHEKAIADELSRTPIWNEFLKDVRGVGPLMAGVIVSEIDINKCNSISALHKYCGLDVVVYENEEGEHEEGRCRKKEHLVPKTYTNRNGEIKETIGITFNPFLKTKLVGVLGSVFIKLGGKYRIVYDGYKHRLQNHPKHKDKTKGHIHNMAVRYMVKEFLADLWTHWRLLEGLPVKGTYAEDVLGIKHHTGTHRENAKNKAA
jgi:Transposase IS116/IS110/IS902 family